MKTDDWATLLVAILGLMIALLLADRAQGHPHGNVDFRLLRDVICNYETEHKRTQAEKDAAVSPAQAISECQLLPTTLSDLGYKYWEVADSEVSRSAALAYLTWCFSNGNASVHALAFCYNPSMNYAKLITLRYYAAVTNRKSARMSWWKAHYVAID